MYDSEAWIKWALNENKQEGWTMKRLFWRAYYRLFPPQTKTQAAIAHGRRTGATVRWVDILKASLADYKGLPKMDETKMSKNAIPED